LCGGFLFKKCIFAKVVAHQTTKAKYSTFALLKSFYSFNGFVTWGKPGIDPLIANIEEHMMQILRSVFLSLSIVAVLYPGGAVLAAQVNSPGSAVTIRGRIVVYKEPDLSVATNTETISVKLSPATNIIGEAAASLTDIAPGVFVGASALKQADGTFRAAQINIFREEERGFLEGHRPQTSLPTHTMTNATVETIENLAVQDVNGRMLTLKFKEGEVKVFVPPNTPIMKRVSGGRDMLKPGAELRVQGAKGEDGAILAQGIIVNAKPTALLK